MYSYIPLQVFCVFCLLVLELEWLLYNLEYGIGQIFDASGT